MLELAYNEADSKKIKRFHASNNFLITKFSSLSFFRKKKRKRMEKEEKGRTKEKIGME